MQENLPHVPVMLPEVLNILSPKNGGIYIDATFGAGGYTTAILKSADCSVIAIDRDPNAIQIYKIGISDIGDDASVLKRNLKVSYYNYAVTEYNERRYNNANTISEEALKLFPNDRDFIKLLSSIPK